MRTWSAVSALVLGLLFVSCSKFGVVGIELQLQYDKDADKLVVLEVDRGVYAGDGHNVDEAMQALEKDAMGRREFPPGQGFTLDFDVIERDLLGRGQDKLSVHDRKVLECSRGVKVAKSGTFVDDDGRLSLYRLWVVPNFRVGLEIVNEAIAEGLLRDDAPFEARFPTFDEETWKLFRARAKKGERWFYVDGDAVVLDAPMTRGCAARCIAHLLAEANKPDDVGIADVFRQVSSLEIKDDRVVMRFDPGADGCLKFTVQNSGAKYVPDILTLMKSRGGPLDEAGTVKQLRGMMKSH